jgi:competence protein ComGC
MTMSTTPAVLSKPRSRRRWYWIGGFVLLVILTPFLVSLIAGWWSERRMQALYAEIDAEDPDWRWPDLIAKIQPRPGEPNSAEQVAKVRALLVSKAFMLPPKWDGEANQKVLHYRNSHLNAEQTQLLRTALGALDSTTVAEARKLKDLPNGRFPIQAVENPFTMTMDYIQHTRSVMHLLSHDAMMRGQDKDYDGAIESCQAILNAARSIRENPALIGQLVRIAGRAIAIEAIERALGQGEASEETHKKLQELLEAEAAEDGLHQAMRGERAGCQQMYESLRSGKVTFAKIMGVPNPGPVERVEAMFPGLFMGGYPDFLRMMNEQVKYAKLKDAERDEAFHKFDEKLRSGRINLMVGLMMPASGKVAEASQRSQAMLRTAVVAVAAERYRLKHDQWPAGMKELIHEGLIKEEYTDPYDGKPLRWKRTATGLIVYSIGKDKIDNGGTLNRNNIVAVGSDIGFELWDHSLRRLPPPAVEEAPK